uniref:Leucine-rich repeat domain-containing protein n=1 Tax=Bionectria ochroleuca TaxID=29856 RepID=A0A8H7KEM3_BIOOC
MATAGVRDWPALTELRGQGEQMREGIDDAFMVLILLWASHLVEFHFTVPLIGSLSQDGDEQLTLGFVSQVARRLRDSPKDAMLDRFPLARLQSVQYKHWDTEFGVQGQFAAPFFYLPNLRTFFGYRIEMTRPSNEESDEDDDDIQSAYLTEFPVGTSTVEDIILNFSDMCLEALQTFIRACRRLRTFALDYGNVLDTREVDSSRLAELLVARADSLQNLALDWGDSPTLEITAQGPLEIEQCFRQLHRLEYLELPLYMLCEDGELDGQTFISLNSQLLPKSLRCLCLVGCAYWRFDSKVEINKMVDSIEAFILKCGPGVNFRTWRLWS